MTAQERQTRPTVAESAARALRAWARRLRVLLFRRLPFEEAQAVRQDVEREGALTERYVLLCALSAGIATLGLLQSSTAVVIGAMLVSPLMSPIASLGFAFASLDGRHTERAAHVLGVGVAVALGVSIVLTWLSPIRNATPEIIARTAPTLLDLAVAVLSGLAGGYATIHRKGETAIGVAIATALMPPVATLGYSIATMRIDFAMGALLLFLTNLAAISFSFALVARMRGVARPFARVEFKPIHVAGGIAAFLVLATPLALTLNRVTQDALITQSARTTIAETLSIQGTDIAQLSVVWPTFDRARVAAIAVTPHYVPDAGAEAQRRLSERLRRPVEVQLQQIVAADPRAETAAMVQSALSQMGLGAGAAPAAAPVDAAVAAARAPVMASWADADAHAIHLVFAPRAGMDLAAYQQEEQRLNSVGLRWRVVAVPPTQERIVIAFANNQSSLSDAQRAQLGAARWALTRWAARQVRVEGVAGANTSASARALALARARAVADALRGDGVTIAADAAATASARAANRQGDVRAALIFPFAAT